MIPCIICCHLLKCLIVKSFTAHIPITTEQKFPLWTKFHPILHIKEVLDCFRLDLLMLLLVLLVLLLVLLLCVRACACYNLLSDNESNTIRVIWYFVML